MKYAFVVSALVLLVVANLLMFLQFGNMTGFAEGFQTSVAAARPAGTLPPGSPPPGMPTYGLSNRSVDTAPTATVSEGFTSYLLESGAGAKDNYQPMGAYDGVQLKTGNTTSTWRYTAPNEKLLGDKFVPGPDSLFLFKNNQCKPECCGASFSCGGGCVCTTPEQRQYLAGRGGNQTAPGDNP
jgi:hypothetical protein